MADKISRMRRPLVAAAAVALAFGGWRGAGATPLEDSTPTVYQIANGDVDFSVFDNSRNPGRISSVATGDIDGDGRAELFLGAPFAYGFQQQVGAPMGMVYVVYGGFSVPSAPRLDLTLTTTTAVDRAVSSLAVSGAAPPGIRGFQMHGELRDMRFGSAIACGDFDGDGAGDFAVSAPRRLTDLVAGRVYIIRGDPVARYIVDLPAMRQAGWVITVVGPGRPGDSYFGEQLAFLDFDNDGRDDLVIGSPRAGFGGEVCIVYGRQFTSDTLAVDQIPTADPLFALIRAEAADDRLGAALATGDLSGDGRADLVIGAPLGDTPWRDAGRVYVLFGADRNTTANLPIPSRVTLSSATAHLIIPGPIAGEALGSALAVGDLDGNGLNDLGIGAPYAMWQFQPSVGKAYILYNDGILTSETQTIWIDTASTTVAVFIGPSAGIHLGASLAIGRFDEDSLEDLMIGVPEATRVGARAVMGAVFLIRGRTAAERPHGEIVLNGGSGSLPSDLTIWAGDWGDRLGSGLALGQFDGALGLDLLVCGKPLAEGGFGSAWVFLGRNPTPYLPPLYDSVRPWWFLYR